MELELELYIFLIKQQLVANFYPCFNGIRVGTNYTNCTWNAILVGFYPCFNGIRVGTISDTH